MLGLTMRSLAHGRQAPFTRCKFHISHPLSFPRRIRPQGLHAYTDVELSDEAYDVLEEPFRDDDTSSVGHLIYRQQRQILFYLRLIEHEMPKLAGEHFVMILVASPITHTILQSIENPLYRQLHQHRRSSAQWIMREKSIQPPSNAS
jgi:hypothetical protein